MAKSNFSNNDVRIAALMDAVKKFHDDQDGNADKLHIKKITLSLDSNMLNPCSGQNCGTGFHAEIYIHPGTGKVSCRCVKD